MAAALHPEEAAKVQAELDAVVGHDRRTSLSLRIVISEILTTLPSTSADLRRHESAAARHGVLLGGIPLATRQLGRCGAPRHKGYYLGTYLFGTV